MIFYTLVILSVAAYVACLWKIFVKAGIPSWHSIVPIYNMWELMKISGKPAWWSLLSIPVFLFLVSYIVPALFMIFFLLPAVVLIVIWLVLYVDAMIELGKRFGQTASTSVFLIALAPLFTWLPIGFAMIAFNKSIQYKDPKNITINPVPQSLTQPAEQPFTQLSPQAPSQLPPEPPTYVSGQ